MTAAGMPRWVDDGTVQDLLSAADLRPYFRSALARFASGVVEVMPRGQAGLTEGKVTHLMMARDNDQASVVTKLIDYDIQRPGRDGRPTGIGLVTYTVDGEPVMLVPTTGFTSVRTAACTAFALDLLAREDATVLAIAGAGPIARYIAVALAAMRPLTAVRLASRTLESARRRAGDLADRLPGLEVTAHERLADACAGAGIVVTASSAGEPILFAGDVAPGTALAAIGAGLPHRRELDGALVGRADRVYVEGLEAAWHEAGDLIIAAAEGHVEPGSGTPLAELLERPRPVEPGELVLYKSVGMAWQDLACAEALQDLLG